MKKPRGDTKVVILWTDYKTRLVAVRKIKQHPGFRVTKDLDNLLNPSIRNFGLYKHSKNWSKLQKRFGRRTREILRFSELPKYALKGK